MTGRRLPGRAEDQETLVPGVALAIRNLIWKGRILPGERLRQDELASSLGVSLIPLREAIRVLEGEGLLQRSPHRGVQVAPISLAETEAFRLEFKAMLLGFLPLALRRLTPETLARLRAIAGTLDQVDLPSEGHLTFWRLIFDPCGMPRLSQTVEQLIWRSGRYFITGGKTVLGQLREVRPNRMDFLDACEAGDAARATRDFLAFMAVRMTAFESGLPGGAGRE